MTSNLKSSNRSIGPDNKLSKIKRKVRDSFDVEKDNYKSYTNMMNFIFNSTLTNTGAQSLNILQKPQLEFNIIESSINRIASDFASHFPEIEVTRNPEVNGNEVSPELISFLEGHIRYVIEDAENSNFCYKTILETLAGGFSAWSVFTDYQSDYSFQKRIFLKKERDPTMVGFSPLADEDSKSDSEYCFELIPTLEEEAKELGVDTSKMDFSRVIGVGAGGEINGNINNSFSGFSWTFQNFSKKIVLICYFYEKHHKSFTLAKLSNGQEIDEKFYPDIVKHYNENRPEQAPTIVERRKSKKTSIKKYVLTENKIISEEELDTSHLPIVYVDGNSILIRSPYASSTRKMSKSYLKNAVDCQRSKNFAGQTLMSELENITQKNLLISQQAFLEEYQQYYVNNQIPSLVMWNEFSKDNPDQRLTPPTMIQKQVIPPEIAQTFTLMDQTMQIILGNFDADLSHMQKDNFSGTAIREVISLANSESKPYIIKYMHSLTQAANIMLDLFPKIYQTPISLPYKEKDGKIGYRIFNDPNNPESISTHYNPLALKVNVKAGVNFMMEQSKAIETLTILMRSSKIFDQFMTGTAKGLEVLLDNISIRGADKLKEEAINFAKNLEEQQKMAQQKAMEEQKSNPEVQKLQIELQRLQQAAEQVAVTSQLKIAELEQRRLEKEQQYSIDLQKLHNDALKISASLAESEENSTVQLVKADTERYVAAIKEAEHHSQHEHRLAQRLKAGEENIEKKENDDK